MKMVVVMFFGLLFFESRAQMLINSKPDSLQEFTKFYYNHIIKPKKVDLSVGLYFLIFDVSVNIDSVTLSLIRKNKSSLIYQRHSGYFFFIVSEKSVVSFNYEYPNDHNTMKLFAKLYRIPDNVIGKELNSEFSIKDIYGNKLDKEALRGYASIFFSSYRYDLFPIINEIRSEYLSDSVVFVSFNKELPYKLNEYKIEHGYNDIIFVSDYLFKLSPWTNNMPKEYPAAIIFVSDDKTRLQYRNVLGINHDVDVNELKSEVFDVLKRIN